MTNITVTSIGQGFVDIAWLLFLLLLFRHFWQDRQALHKTGHWLVTKGHITKLIWSEEGEHLWPKIEYMYQVYDRDFVGECFFLDASYNNPTSQYSRQLAYQTAMAFERNEEIDVFYNPDNPKQAALDLHIPIKLNIILALLICLIMIHVLTIIYKLL